MGVLDDAIREHLELRRKHGASEAEIERKREEALSPARRDAPSSDAHDDSLDEVPTLLAEPPDAPDSADGDADRHERPQPISQHETEVDRSESIREKPSIDDLPVLDRDPLLHDEALLGGDAEIESKPRPIAPAEPHTGGRDEIFDPLEEEDEALPPLEDSPDPELDFDDEPDPDAAPRPRLRPAFGTGESPSPGARSSTPLPPPLEPPPEDDVVTRPPEPEPEPPPAEAATHSTDEASLLDDAEPLDEPAAHAGAESLDDPALEDEDPLEETPDFLQETPEHDRLWFEQKPPRDFDFDD